MNTTPTEPSVFPVIPEFITVHLGAPSQKAQNVRIPFIDYIKNVASGEIYPTWPDAALRANIYAQISFALNRVYTEFYRSQGYDFDITSLPAYDQTFKNGRDIFDNISKIVDQIFNSYVNRRGFIEPLFASYCNGTTTTCDGLSQWGSVDLAEQGRFAYDILTYYYGDDIDIVTNVPVQPIGDSAPEIPLSLGSIGNDVRTIQLRINRVSQNYPAIPKIYPVDGIFGEETDRAVREFQKIFNLTVDGIVGNATWYRILLIFNGVKQLNSIISEGLTYAEVERQFSETLGPGDRGFGVELVQYLMLFISYFVESIPQIKLDGIYGSETEAAVSAFQSEYGLPSTGVVDVTTWEYAYDIYAGIINELPQNLFENSPRPYPGIPIRDQTQNESVVTLQTYLQTVSEVYPEIPTVEVTGIYDAQTQEAVLAFQRFFGLPENTVVSARTWDAIGDIWENITRGYDRSEGQYPGYTVSNQG